MPKSETKKLILLDIDGTILNGKGTGKRSIQAAMIKIFGTAGDIDNYDLHGKTDPQIATDLLTKEGYSKDSIIKVLPILFDIYLSILKKEVKGGRALEVLPGVREFIKTIARNKNVIAGLLTGNIEEGAKIKLNSIKLWKYFQIGAFGSDSENRNELPGFAIKRAKNKFGMEFKGKDIIIIGDTPLDIECGEEYNAMSVAVATGKHTTEELKKYKPDFVFENLADYKTVIKKILY